MFKGEVFLGCRRCQLYRSAHPAEFWCNMQVALHVGLKDFVA